MYNEGCLFEGKDKETQILECLLRIEKKLDKLIDLMSINRPTPSNICSRYNYKGMVNGECIFEDEYGHRVTEAELRKYQEDLKDLWNDSVEDVYDKERFWNEPEK